MKVFCDSLKSLQLHWVPFRPLLFLTHHCSSHSRTSGSGSHTTAMALKDTRKTPMEPEAAIHWITLTSCNVKIAGEGVCWFDQRPKGEESQSERTSRDASKTEWEALQGKLPLRRALRLGVTFRWGATSGPLTGTPLLMWVSGLFPPALSQESRLKSPMQVFKSIFLINWLSIALNKVCSISW